MFKKISTFIKGLFDKEDINTIPVIDVSDDMNAIIKQLTRNWKSFCNYDEIQRIKEKDRLPILKYVWSNWMRRMEGIKKELYYNYSQYDKSDLEFVIFMEHWRLNTLFHSQNYNKILNNAPMSSWFLRYSPFLYNDEYNPETREYKIKILKLCKPQDMPKIFKVWREKDNKINRMEFQIFGHDDLGITKEVEEIYLFKDNQEEKITPEELKEFCIENHYSYPLYDEEYAKSLKEKKYKDVLKDFEELYNKGKINKDKYNKLKEKYKNKD